MAKIIFSGIEPRAADQLANLLTVDGHEVRRAKTNIPMGELLDATVVFAGGEPDQYLSVLRRIRAVDSSLCFVVVTRNLETPDWLEALEAGVTDYLSPPFDLHQLRALIRAGIYRKPAAAVAVASPF